MLQKTVIVLKKNIFKVLILLMMCQILLCVLFARIVPPKIELDSQMSQNKEFIISSTSKSFINALFISSYPFIKTKLTDPQYPLTYYGEVFRKIIHQYDSFSYAKKRMTELFDSRNDVRIGKYIKNVADNPTLAVNNLKTWWYKRRPSLLEGRFVAPYNTWETGLARYVIDMEDYISLLEKNNSGYDENIAIKKTRLKLEIVEDQKNLLNIVTTKNIPEADKKYITNLSRNVFQYLLQKPLLVPNAIDFSHLFFDLKPIISNKEFGLYDAYIDPTQLPVNENMSFSDGTYEYSNILASNTIDSSYAINFHQILVDTNPTSPMLNLSQNISIPLSNWLATDVFEKGEWIHRYIYTFNVPENIRTKDYLFGLKKTTNKKITYHSSMNVNQINKIQYGIDKKNITKKVVLINEDLPAVTDEILYQRMMEFDRAALPKQIDFTVDTNQSLNASDLNNIVLILTPIYQPELSMVKRTSLPNISPELTITRKSPYRFDVTGKNISKKMSEQIQKQLGITWLLLSKPGQNGFSYLAHIYFIPQLLSFVCFIALLLLTVILFFQDHIMRFGQYIRKGIVRGSLVAHNSLLRIAKKFSLLFLLVALCALYIDTFFIKERYELVIACILLFWIFAIDGLAMEGTINFVFAGIFFAVQLIFMTVKSLDIAEKSAGWTYIFLIFGFLHIALQKLFKMDNLYPYSDFYYQFKFHLKKHFARPYRICKWLGNVVIRFISKIYFILVKFISIIFVMSPKSKKDWARNILVLFLLIIVSLALSIGAFSTIQHIRLELAKKEAARVRLSRNPIIVKIEPHLVYYSTNVIMNGSGFGWQESDKSRLMTKYGEVGTKLWTDTKIIFSVPLHWKSGIIKLQIEKPIMWNGKQVVARSNVETITIIPRSDNFTKLDDEYFKQLKTLSKEALRINGYTDEQ